LTDYRDRISSWAVSTATCRRYSPSRGNAQIEVEQDHAATARETSQPKLVANGSHALGWLMASTHLHSNATEF